MKDKILELEAILFSIVEPISTKKLSLMLNITSDDIKKILNNLNEYYINEKRGIVIYFFNDKVQLGTNPIYHDTISNLYKDSTQKDLSTQAYEVLSIIAYKQPITKYQIEEIRGLNSDKIISNLISKNLIHVKGILDKPGRPKLYGTTEQFLRNFGINNIKDLPDYQKIVEDLDYENK
jgi:segregation and condensation protein B